ETVTHAGDEEELADGVAQILVVIDDQRLVDRRHTGGKVGDVRACAIRCCPRRASDARPGELLLVAVCGQRGAPARLQRLALAPLATARIARALAGQARLHLD